MVLRNVLAMAVLAAVVAVVVLCPWRVLADTHTDADNTDAAELEHDDVIDFDKLDPDNLPEGYERLHNMHPSSLPHGDGEGEAEGEWGTHHDDADFPQAPPHSHDSHPHVKMHSLWITPVLDVNVASLLSDKLRAALITLGTSAWEAFKDTTPSPHHTIEAFVAWQTEAAANNLTSLAETEGPEAVQAIALLNILALEAAESLLLASGTDKEVGNIMEHPDSLSITVMVFDDPRSELPVSVSPQASVKGVFYASAPQSAPPIVFDDPRKGGPFTSNSYEAAPEPLDMLMFPAWLEHSIPHSITASTDDPTVVYSFVVKGNHEALVEVSFSEGGEDDPGHPHEGYDDYEEDGHEAEWMREQFAEMEEGDEGEDVLLDTKEL